MILIILSPKKKLHVEDVDCVTLPGTLGPFQVLQNHAPIISSLQPGMLSFKVKGQTETLQVEGGFAEVKDNTITVCIDSLESDKRKFES